MDVQPERTFFSLSGETLTLEVVGFNRPLLIKKLQKAQIKIKKVVILSAQSTLLTIPYKQLQKTFAICNNMCYTCSVRERAGLLCILKNLLKRVGLVLGAVVFAVASIFCNGKLFCLEISGLESVGEIEIAEYLKANGVNVGTQLSPDVCKRVQDLLLKHDKIAGVTVSAKGNALIITVVETTPSQSRPQIKREIVSDCDGRVSKIVCRSGTAKVKVGQIVKSGQTLIIGETFDQNGEVLENVNVEGEVYISTTIAQSFAVGENFYEYEKTGNEYCATALRLFGLTFFQTASPYKYCSAQTSTAKLFGILPITVVQTRYCETEKVKTDMTVERYAKEQAEKLRLDTIVKGATIIDSKYHVEQIASGEYLITVYVTAERIMT